MKFVGIQSNLTKRCGDRTHKLIAWSAWLYLLFSLCIVAVVRFAGDQWWLATILLFSPRWIFSLPLLLLLPLAFWNNRLQCIPITLAALIIFVPFMGFNCPHIGPDVSSQPPKTVLRLLSLNVDVGKFNPAQLVSQIKDSAVDIVALQEYPDGLKLPLPKGWNVVSERRLAVISKFPVTIGSVIQVTPPHSIWPGTYLLHTTVHTLGGDIAFCSVQLPTPRFGLQRVMDRYTLLRPSRRDLLLDETSYRWRVSQEIHKFVSTLTVPVIIAGDFNTPPDSTLYKQTWSSFRNAFSEAGWGYGWTQRVAYHGIPFGARIDHILTGVGIMPLLCKIGKDVGSDHLPIIADVVLYPPF